ncbi:MAG: hypothetical protein ACK56F_06140, partial [bacterium]
MWPNTSRRSACAWRRAGSTSWASPSARTATRSTPGWCTSAGPWTSREAVSRRCAPRASGCSRARAASGSARSPSPPM